MTRISENSIKSFLDTFFPELLILRTSSRFCTRKGADDRLYFGSPKNFGFSVYQDGKEVFSCASSISQEEAFKQLLGWLFQ